MKTLENHILIYDRDCPICKLYTGAFIKTNMLDPNGRTDYCSIDSSTFPNLDMARAKDEIALVNTRTGNVTYGIDSLFKILATRFPVLKYIFMSGVFRLAMNKLYSFVSFNRKVIAPGEDFESPTSCTPSFNLRYRWAYIMLSWIFTSVVLSQYAMRLSSLVPPTNFFREWLICGGQIIFQSIAISLIREDRIVHYLGNMMTVSNIGALLLLPALLIPNNFLQPEVYVAFFGVVVFIMLLEHYRRTKILGLTVWASVSWVAYRLIVLGIILW
jgi:predicted DCC family thiol-disulfide oxidoreductase YuxK